MTLVMFCIVYFLLAAPLKLNHYSRHIRSGLSFYRLLNMRIGSSFYSPQEENNDQLVPQRADISLIAFWSNCYGAIHQKLSILSCSSIATDPRFFWI